MISKASDCTINQYIKCLFDNNYTVLGEGSEQEQKEAFHNIETEYIDLSGQFETGEYETIRNILALSSRIELINTLFYIEDTFLKEFKHPFLPAFKEFKKFGYTLKWNDDIEDFYDQLLNVKSSEQSYLVDLEIEKKKLKKPETDEEKSPAKRADFIRMLIGLQKQKYIIDRNVTTVEDLAIMVSELREQMMSNEVKPTE